MAKHSVIESTADALGGSKKEAKPKKEVKEMHIKKAANGGHIITHHHTHPEAHPSEEHVTKSPDDLGDHVMQHMTEPNPGEAEADAGQGGIPDTSAAQAGGPPAAGAGQGAGPIPGM